MSDEEAQDTMAADPGHVKRWLGRGRDTEALEYSFLKPLTPSTTAVECLDSASGGVSVYDHDLNASIAESMPNICSAEAGVRPLSSGVTATPMPVTRSLVAYGSDLDSEFDDEFDEPSIETTAVETGRSRDIPDDEDLEESVREVINGIERAIDDEADRMNGTSSSFTWQEDFDTFGGIPEFFSGNSPGPIKDYDTPYDCFVEIWDKEIIEHIAQETNRYAKQTIDSLEAKGELKPSSRLHKWAPTDADEIFVLFAVIMYMGIDARTSQNEYWRSDNFLEMPKFKKIMTYQRYVLLNKFLHFVDNNCMRNEEGLSPKLVKLGPVIRHLNSKFSTVYNLAREISIDESLTLFKGRLSWIQAIRTKAARFGIKSFELCESSTGYMYKFEIYTGKNSASLTVAPSTDLGGKSTLVVLDLLKGLENLGHCVTMDNYYNCPSLARYLKSLGFDCLGTLRPNRRHVPNDIAKIPKNVAKGTMIARHCGDVSVVAWKDSKLVTIISTYHNDDTYVGSRAGKVLVKPISVRDYNNTMGGVDLKDQKLSMYLLERKRGLKWYVKIFKRLLNVSIHNAFVMYVSSLKRQNKASMTHREFRYSLAKSLVVKHRPCLPEVVQPVEELMRLRRDVVHVPKYETGRNNRKRCVVCFRQSINKMVHSQCVTCGVFLCFEVCWPEWHSSVNLKGREPRGRTKAH